MVELVAVLVIAGVLSVICVAEFVNLRSAASNATASELGTQIASAASMNYSRGIAIGGGTTIAGASACTAAASLAALPSGYTIVQGISPVASGQFGECAIWNTSMTGAQPKSFTVIGCANSNCS